MEKRKFATGYWVHQLFTETSLITMATGFGPLAEVTWTEAERRCPVVMILTRKGAILTDSEIADLTGVDCRCVNQLRKALTETRDSRQVAMVMVFGVVLSEGDVMPSHIFETGLRVNTDIYLEAMESTVLPWIKTVAGVRPWEWQQDSAPAMYPNRSIEWSRTTATTWSRRTAGLPAVLILIRWTILCEATSRHILTDVSTIPRPPWSPPLRRTLPPWTRPWWPRPAWPSEAWWRPSSRLKAAFWIKCEGKT